MDNTEKLFFLTGVAAEYLDYSGQRHVFPRETRRRVLQVCGLRANDENDIAKAVFELDAKPWQSWLLQFYLLDEGFSGADPVAGVGVHCHPSQLQNALNWHLCTEQGEEFTGRFVPALQPETGDYVIDSVRYSRRHLPLPELPLGYHHLRLRDASGRTEETRVIVCPLRCFNPVAQNDRLWGISCQLYTLRSERNWGIGDFADLQELVVDSTRLGADFIGLNPLHASCTDSPDAASPYSPSDRRFLSPIYLCLEQIADFQCQSVQDWFAEAGIEQELQGLRALRHVDYDAVNRLKYACLELMYAEFCNRQLARHSQRAVDFERFVDRQGEALQLFAGYEVEHNRFISRTAGDTRFFCYLQWLAFTQLEQCQRAALAGGMQIGLLGDLAVGSVPQGCEVRTNQQLYVEGATIGAPPDPLGPLGQDWGLPVLNPVALRAEGYRHFIALLRANMKSYGALRVDHAMSLLRLWWCLRGDAENERSGIYVYYPLADLMALLRLESVRNGCMVIGEDLGVVPREFSEAMAASGLYSNNLLYFDQYLDQYFKPPHEQQADALLMVTNHDVPTLCDWWNGGDLLRRKRLGLITDDADLQAQQRGRRHEKQKLLNWLAQTDMLPHRRSQDDVHSMFDYELCASIHRACARGASRLLLLQLEDLQLMQEPVNIPGTWREYPNWRRKQKHNTREIFASSEAQLILRLVNEERTRERT